MGVIMCVCNTLNRNENTEICKWMPSYLLKKKNYYKAWHLPGLVLFTNMEKSSEDSLK